MSNSLWPYALQPARLPCPSLFSWSSLKFMSIASVMLSNHLILCRSLLLLPSIFPFHQGPSQWIGSLHQVAKVLELHLQHQSFQWIFRVDFPNKYRIQKDTFLKASLWKMSFIWRVETVLKFVILNPSPNFKNDQFIPNLVHLCLSSPLYNWVIHWVGQKFHSSFLQNVTEQTFWTSPVAQQ